VKLPFHPAVSSEVTLIVDRNEGMPLPSRSSWMFGRLGSFQKRCWCAQHASLGEGCFARAVYRGGPRLEAPIVFGALRGLDQGTPCITLSGCQRMTGLANEKRGPFLSGTYTSDPRISPPRISPRESTVHEHVHHPASALPELTAVPPFLQATTRLVTIPKYSITLCVLGAGRFGHGSPSVQHVM
jgi:hypothetical protein